MVQAFERATRIQRRPDEVWAALTDWEHATEWMPGVEAIAPVDGQGGVPSKLRFSARGKDRDAMVRAWEPDRRLVLESTQGGVTAIYEYLLAANGPATDMRLRASCVTRGALWRLASPLLVVAMRLTDGPQLKRLRTAIERRHG
jgi:uncharacterized protein YndB with AHSA1/START domain